MHRNAQVSLDEVLWCLRQRGLSTRQRGSQWECQCPAHDDRHASLGARVGEDGKVLLFCQAGCTFLQIITALGIEPARAPEPFRPPLPKAAPPPKPRIVAKYDYVDAGGELVYQVVRTEPKGFRQRRPDHEGGWIWDLEGVTKILYRLPEIQEHPDLPVWIVEGEKDADALRGRGRIATCNPGGAGKWRPEYAAELKGRKVYIVPDNDEPGRRHAASVAESLAGHAASVLTVLLPGNLNGRPIKDASDWLAAGGTVEQLEGLARKPGRTAEPVLVRLGSVQAEPIRWLWKGRIALGKLTLIAGDPGLGKSYLSLYMAARVSHGQAWPDDPTSHAPKGSVIIMSAEDSDADTIRPRLDAAGADVDKVYHLHAARRTASDGVQREKSVTLADLDVIEAALEDLAGDARLLVLDPVSSYLGGTDSHKNADVRGLLAPLSSLAARHNVAVVMITHLTKGNSQQGPASALYRVMGSLAFAGAARAAYLVMRDAADADRRLLLPMKNNLARDTEGLAYRFADGTIAFDSVPVYQTADQALASIVGEGTSREVRPQVKDWLEDLLTAAGGGGVASSEIRREAQDAGMAWRTVERAREELPIKVFKSGQGGWRWRWLGGQNPQDRHQDRHEGRT